MPHDSEPSCWGYILGNPIAPNCGLGLSAEGLGVLGRAFSGRVQAAASKMIPKRSLIWTHMSYGLNLGWGGPIGDYTGF